jgi:hypothetical protein
MKRLIIFFVSVLLAKNMPAQNADPSLIPQEEVSYFLHSMYKSDPFFRRLKFVDKPVAFSFSSPVIKSNPFFYLHFDTTDLSVPEQQLQMAKDITWDNSFIREASLISYKEFTSIFSPDNSNDWSDFWHKHGDGYYMISYPLFNSDRSYCVIYTEYSIGPLGGSGEVRFYKKNKKGWQLVKTVSLWDS